MKRVTVLMATYNGEKYLDEQIQSIYDQEAVDISLLVRDDGSKDSTIEILENWKCKTENDTHFSLEYYCGDKGLGAAMSFMDLLRRSEDVNSYYALCDQDDKWLPEKLKVAVEKIDELENGTNNDIPILYNSNTKRVNEKLEEVDHPFKKKYHTEKFPAALMSTAAGGLTFVFNKKLLMELKRYTPSAIPMHDRWIFLVCTALGGRVYYDDNSYVLYRQHGKNVTGGSNHMDLKGINLFLFRFRKLFTYTDSPSTLAKELLAGYEAVIPKENIKALRMVSEGRDLKNRLRILFNNNLKTGYIQIDIKLMLQTISGKL